MTNRFFRRFSTFALSLMTAGLVLCTHPESATAQLVYPSSESAPSAAPVLSQPAKKTRASQQAVAPRDQTGYYLDFRSRYALSYGHTFVVFGKLGTGGKAISKEVAGLHPAGDDVTPWSIGHIIPVPSETGASDGDTEDQYITASYRIHLTAAQYQDVVGFIRKLQASSPVWHAVFYNCNAFVADIARHMGLSSPGTLAFPADFINGIRTMNGGVSRITLPDAHASASLLAPR